ncbi:hypothetical protein QZH41_016973 [Actinostola sp. cb2023]|nr:hypothetical protein QZH41_016973 [Actinostola sp. cb2023]
MTNYRRLLVGLILGVLIQGSLVLSETDLEPNAQRVPEKIEHGEKGSAEYNVDTITLSGNQHTKVEDETGQPPWPPRPGRRSFISIKAKKAMPTIIRPGRIMHKAKRTLSRQSPWPTILRPGRRDDIPEEPPILFRPGREDVPKGPPILFRPGREDVPKGPPILFRPGREDVPKGPPILFRPGREDVPKGPPILFRPGREDVPKGPPILFRPGREDVPKGPPILFRPGREDVPKGPPILFRPGREDVPKGPPILFRPGREDVPQGIEIFRPGRVYDQDTYLFRPGRDDVPEAYQHQVVRPGKRSIEYNMPWTYVGSSVNSNVRHNSHTFRQKAQQLAKKNKYELQQEMSDPNSLQDEPQDF